MVPMRMLVPPLAASVEERLKSVNTGIQASLREEPVMEEFAGSVAIQVMASAASSEPIAKRFKIVTRTLSFIIITC